MVHAAIHGEDQRFAVCRHLFGKAVELSIGRAVGMGEEQSDIGRGCVERTNRKRRAIEFDRVAGALGRFITAGTERQAGHESDGEKQGTEGNHEASLDMVRGELRAESPL